MGCCRITTNVLTPIFIVFNALIILLSLVFVIWNLAATFLAISSQWLNELSSLTSIPISSLNTIILLGTLIVSFFSGLAAMGLEAASFRKYWKTEVFTCCGISILKLKMWVYSIVTFVLACLNENLHFFFVKIQN